MRPAAAAQAKPARAAAAARCTAASANNQSYGLYAANAAAAQNTGRKSTKLLLYRLFHDSTLNHRFRASGISFIHDRYQQLYLLFDAYMETEEHFVLAKFLDF